MNKRLKPYRERLCPTPNYTDVSNPPKNFQDEEGYGLDWEEAKVATIKPKETHE